jgi:hypothetical protein
MLLPIKNKIDYYVATPICTNQQCCVIKKKKKCFEPIIEKYSFIDIISKHLFFNGKLIFYENYKELSNVFCNIKIDAVLISDVPTITSLKKIYDILGYLPNVYFVPHGITVVKNVKTLFKRWHFYITFMVMGKYQVDGLNVPVKYCNNQYKRRIFELNGLPQFDYLLFTINHYKNIDNQTIIRDELNITKNDKFILIIVGIDGNCSRIVKLIDLIHTLLPNYYVVLRNKINNFTLPKGYGKFVRQCSMTRTLYDYLFADINVIYLGGTSYIEALFANSRTILYQCDNEETKHKDLIVDGYDYLLVSKTIPEFKKHISYVQSDYVETIEYLKDVQKYLLNVCNTDKIDFVSDSIIDIIQTDVKNNFYNKDISQILLHDFIQMEFQEIKDLPLDERLKIYRSRYCAVQNEEEKVRMNKVFLERKESIEKQINEIHEKILQYTTQTTSDDLEILKSQHSELSLEAQNITSIITKKPKNKKKKITPPKEPPKEPLKEPPKEPPNEPPVKPPKEPPKELPKEPQVKPPKEPPKELPKEPPVKPPKEPPKELPKEPQVKPPKEPPKELPKEPQVKPPKEPPKELPKEPQVKPPKEPQKEHSEEPQKEPQKEHSKAHPKETRKEQLMEPPKKPPKEPPRILPNKQKKDKYKRFIGKLFVKPITKHEEVVNEPETINSVLEREKNFAKAKLMKKNENHSFAKQIKIIPISSNKTENIIVPIKQEKNIPIPDNKTENIPSLRKEENNSSSNEQKEEKIIKTEEVNCVESDGYIKGILVEFINEERNTTCTRCKDECTSLACSLSETKRTNTDDISIVSYVNDEPLTKTFNLWFN